MELSRRNNSHYINTRLWDRLEAQPGMHPVSKLNEYCQAMRLGEVAYMSAMSGRSHCPVITVYAQLGHIRVSGQGSSKQEAKRRTAKNLWYAINAA